MSRLTDQIALVLAERIRSYTLVAFDDDGNLIQMHHAPSDLDDIALRAAYSDWQAADDEDDPGDGGEWTSTAGD